MLFKLSERIRVNNGFILVYLCGCYQIEAIEDNGVTTFIVSNWTRNYKLGVSRSMNGAKDIALKHAL